MDPARDPLVIAPSGTHTHTVILLHRDGQPGQDLYDELKQYHTTSGQTIFEALPSATTKWVFPSARLYGWAASISKDFYGGEEYNIVGYRHHVERLRVLLQNLKEADGIDDDKIVLGGFGQGFAQASQVLLTMPNAMAGFFGVSGWIPYVTLTKKIMREAGDNDRTIENYFHAMYSPAPYFGRGNATETPIFISRSQTDEEEMLDARTELAGLGHEVSFRTYPVDGNPLESPQAVDELVAFLKPLLGA